MGGQPSKMGWASIDVYALQRELLVEERLRVLNDLRFQFQQLRHLVETQNRLVQEGAEANVRAENLIQIGAIRKHIDGLLNKKAPYLAMLREWVRKTRKAGRFDDLIAFGIDPKDLI